VLLLELMVRGSCVCVFGNSFIYPVDPLARSLWFAYFPWVGLGPSQNDCFSN